MEVHLENTTKKLCVIGDPVGHSLSPVIQNAMIRALGLDYIYLCQPVPRGQAGKWLRCADFAGYAGFNATMPHKEELFPLMDELDDDAYLMGAVNTVSIREGKYHGFNTDGAGFVESLRELGGQPEGSEVVLMGAGGAARAVAFKLAQLGAKRVTIANRTVEKAELLAAMEPTGRVEASEFSWRRLGELCERADLLVNCTSMGMTGVRAQFGDFCFLDTLKRDALVCDLIYAPARTELLRQAELRGLRCQNGLGMLIHQAVLALEHFVGQPLDRETAVKAAREALGHAL